MNQRNKAMLLALLAIAGVFIIVMTLYNIAIFYDIKAKVKCENECRIPNLINPGSCVC